MVNLGNLVQALQTMEMDTQKRIQSLQYVTYNQVLLILSFLPLLYSLLLLIYLSFIYKITLYIYKYD